MAAMTVADRMRSIGFSKKDILNLDPELFSAEDKRALIDLLYGDPNEWTWKKELQSLPFQMKRWDRLLGERSPEGTPYRYQPKLIESIATRYPPQRIGHAVTDFTDWLYRLYMPKRDVQQLETGRRVEREIAMRRVPVPRHDRWKLVFNGMGDSSEAALPISELTVGGEALRGKPDLVFREKKTNRILIVEIKATEADVPSDGWPNLRAQLWAYSKIDAWKDAEDILLVGEIWGYARMHGLRIRRTLNWRKGEIEFERNNAVLFAEYCKHCERLVR